MSVVCVASVCPCVCMYVCYTLQIEGLPTIVFIPKDGSKPALRTEGLLPAEQIVDIVKDMAKTA